MSLRESIVTAICLLERAGVDERRGGVRRTDAVRRLGGSERDRPLRSIATNGANATLNGLMRRIFVLRVRAASQRSTARCALSQNSAELPNRRESRRAISGLKARRARNSSLMVWRETPKASARPEMVRP
jgi:hypothetical protein